MKIIASSTQSSVDHVSLPEGRKVNTGDNMTLVHVTHLYAGDQAETWCGRSQPHQPACTAPRSPGICLSVAHHHLCANALHACVCVCMMQPSQGHSEPSLNTACKCKTQNNISRRERVDHALMWSHASGGKVAGMPGG